MKRAASRVGAASPPRRRLATIALLATLPILCALVIRHELKSDPFYELLVVDARTAHDQAAAMAGGVFEADAPFWQPPGYSLFLSLLYRFFGVDPEVARFAQIALLGGIAALTHLLARRWFGPVAAWAAWGCIVLYGPLYVEALQLLNVTLGIFLVLLAVWFATDRAAPKTALASGASLGLAGITVAQLLVVAPILLVWLAGLRNMRRPVAGLFLAGLLTPIALVAAHNFGVSGEWIPISYNGGINFWLGNTPQVEQTVAIRPGRGWLALTAEPFAHGATGYAAQSDYFYRKALAWMASAPLEALTLFARKSLQWVQGVELLRNQEVYPWTERSALLRALLWVNGVAFPFGLLFPFAATGAALAFSKAETRRTAFRPALLVAALAAVTVAYFVTGRYRLPAVPFLAVLAGFAFARIAAARHERLSFTSIRTLGPAAVFVAAFLLSNLGLTQPPKEWNSDAYVDLGFQRQIDGDRTQAEALYRRALELDPENLEAKNNLGGVLVESGRQAEALPLFEQVLAAHPDDRKARNNLGSALFRMAEAYQAGWQFLQLSRMTPPEPGADVNLALSHDLAAQVEADWMARDPERFMTVLERALAATPENEFLRDRLDRLRARRGNAEPARGQSQPGAGPP